MNIVKSATELAPEAFGRRALYRDFQIAAVLGCRCILVVCFGLLQTRKWMGVVKPLDGVTVLAMVFCAIALEELMHWGLVLRLTSELLFQSDTSVIFRREKRVGTV